MAYTVDQLCTEISALSALRDGASTPDGTLMRIWVNDAITQVFQDTHCVVTHVDVTLDEGVSEYEMDRGILAILNFAQPESSPSVRLTQITSQEFIERRWLAAAGTVTYFALIAPNLIAFTPTPTGADQIIFYVVPVPDEVTGSDDVYSTGLPLSALEAVKAYMMVKAAQRNQDFTAAQFWQSSYDKQVGESRVQGRSLAGRTLAAGRIGYPSRHRGPSRNDTYPAN